MGGSRVGIRVLVSGWVGGVGRKVFVCAWTLGGYL